MMQSPEFISAEVAYRTGQVAAEFRQVRRRRTLLSYLHLRSRTGRDQGEQVRVARSRTGLSDTHVRLAS